MPPPRRDVRRGFPRLVPHARVRAGSCEQSERLHRPDPRRRVQRRGALQVARVRVESARSALFAPRRVRFGLLIVRLRVIERNSEQPRRRVERVDAARRAPVQRRVADPG